MTQEDKDLLLRDLCARLPYGVICMTYIVNHQGVKENWSRKKLGISVVQLFIANEWYGIYPYLRPLSNLTQEERNKFCDIGGVISYRPDDGKQYIVAFVPEALDYLNSIHADYRGLIEKGLAIEVTDENNPYK